MRKRLLIGLLSAGLMGAMLPGVASAAHYPDPQAHALEGICVAHGGTFEYSEVSNLTLYECDLTRPIPREALFLRLIDTCNVIIRTRGGYDQSVFGFFPYTGEPIESFTCTLARYP